MKITVSVMAMLFLAQSAQAGIYLEPLVGGYNGTYKLSATTSGTTTDKTISGTESGQGFGLRAGFLLPGGLIFLGGNYVYTKGISEQEKQSTAPTSDILRSETGAVAGLKLMNLRLWLGYNFTDTMDDTSRGIGSKSDSYTGTSMLAGLGYILDMNLKISINVEYVMHAYTQVAIGSTGDTIKLPSIYAGTSYDKPLLTTDTFISLSMPFFF